MKLFVTVVTLAVSAALARVASGQTAEHWYRCNTHTHTASFPESDGVASDDVHDYFNFDDRSAPTPGKAWIVVRAPALTLDAVMEALRRGRFYGSSGVALADYRVDAKGISIRIDPPFAWRSRDKESVLYRTRFSGREGRTLAEMPGLAPHYEFTGSEAYVRATIVDSDGRRAWTQPVFRDGRATP